MIPRSEKVARSYNIYEQVTYDYEVSHYLKFALKLLSQLNNRGSVREDNTFALLVSC